MPLDLQRPVTQRPARLPALWLAALLAWTCTQGAAATADSAASRVAVLDADPGLRASLGRHNVAGRSRTAVARDGHEAFTALAALIAAHGEGQLAEARRARSLERLATMLTLPSS